MFNSFTAVTYNAEYRSPGKFKIAGVHWSILAMILLVIVLEFLLQKTPAFKKFYFIGNGRRPRVSTASSRIAISALHL